MANRSTGSITCVGPVYSYTKSRLSLNAGFAKLYDKTNYNKITASLKKVTKLFLHK
jgi:hypothetical protein